MVDFRLCRWPEAVQTGRDTAIAEYFDGLNEPVLSYLAEMREGVDDAEPLISFSHYLPLQVRAALHSHFLALMFKFLHRSDAQLDPLRTSIRG